MFAPAEDFPVESHFPPGLSPVSDRCERGALAAAVCLPAIHDHRLTCSVELESLRRWHEAIGVADVFPVGKKRAVWREVFNCLLSLVKKINLHIHRVGSQI